MILIIPHPPDQGSCVNFSYHITSNTHLLKQVSLKYLVLYQIT